MSLNLPDELDAMASPAGMCVRAEIEERSRITFARFMEIALYGPQVGYYEARAAEDFRRDYVTSPEVHPAFGVLLCAQLEEMWRRLGRPGEFWVVEGGPGTGALAADVLATAEEAFPTFSRALRLALIERSTPLLEVQRSTLAQWRGSISWLDVEGSPVPLGPGCVFANELLDAFSVHRVVMRADGLRETYVSLSGDWLEEVEDWPSTPAIEQQIRAGAGHLRVHARGEVNLAAPLWVKSVARLLERGYLLLLDYGEPADLLYGERHPRGTLRCYSRHTMNEKPYARVGLQDITADVDLSAVARAGVESGFDLLAATHQAHLLDRLGLDTIRRAIDQEVAGRVEGRAHHAALDLLSDARHLGRISALLLGKGIPAEPLTGFREGGRLAPPRADGVLELRLTDVVRIAEGLRG